MLTCSPLDFCGKILIFYPQVSMESGGTIYVTLSD